MATNLEMIQLATRSILDDCPWQLDHEVLEIPWRYYLVDETRSRICSPGGADGKLRFGVLSTDGFVRPHPPVARALQVTIAALRAKGYEVSIRPRGPAI